MNLKKKINQVIYVSATPADYEMEKSDFSGLFSTLVLGDIALLFILPTTGEFTRNEKSVCLNILMILEKKIGLNFPYYIFILNIFVFIVRS